MKTVTDRVAHLIEQVPVCFPNVKKIMGSGLKPLVVGVAELQVNVNKMRAELDEVKERLAEKEVGAQKQEDNYATVQIRKCCGRIPSIGRVSRPASATCIWCEKCYRECYPYNTPGVVDAATVFKVWNDSFDD
jgi:hypothetical protein